MKSTKTNLKWNAVRKLSNEMCNILNSDVDPSDKYIANQHALNLLELLSGEIKNITNSPLSNRNGDVR
ncbi:hypothetical protein ACBZ91_18465 [Vibrio natriegens]|uniref:hypothetical protein n=1 Tax=Vibrio natriegens TaxID=691 RepID=UPI003557F4FD